MREARPTLGAMLKAYDGLKLYEKEDIPENERVKGTKILVEDLAGNDYWVEKTDVRIDYKEDE